MTDFTITNKSNVEIQGSTGEDRLIFTYNTTTDGVWLTNLSPLATGAQSANAGGYAGQFNGMGANDAGFSGIEHFTFSDQSGGNDDIRTGDGDDILNGGAGNDNLEGQGGINQIDGGAGNDRAQLAMSWTSTAIKINLNTNSTFLSYGSLTNVESMDLTTGSGNDTITGHQTSAMADAIRTGAGNDSITLWMGGSDTVNGGAGSDVLMLTYAIPTNDVWLTDLASDTVSGGYKGIFNGMGSNDVSFSGIERFSFTDASGGNDIIRTGNGTDTLNGGAGNDQLVGNGGADIIDGGTGNDLWGGSFGTATTAFTINLNGASTFLTTGSVKNTEAMSLLTGSGSDNVTGHKTASMADSVKTGAGNDSITLWMGSSDTVDGGTGSDVLIVTDSTTADGVWLTDLSADTVSGGYKGMFNGEGSNDISFSGIERFSFTDTSGGNDIINTGVGADTLNGGLGDDQLLADGGADIIDGGAGNDLWSGRFGTATGAFAINLNGTSTLLGTGSLKNVEAMNLVTGSGNDTITGHKTASMADSVKSGAGNDSITLWMGGSDTVEGASGNDVLILTYAVPTNDVWLTDLTADTVSGGYKGMFNGMGSNDVSFSGIERFSFTDASGGNDIIRTGDGADTLNGGAGNDALNSGGGNDLLNGGAGKDTLDGGTGIDTADYTEKATSVVATLNGATAVNVSIAGIVEDSIKNIENLTGGSAADHLTGDGLANRLTGNGGNDVLDGKAGGDTMLGGAGNDTYYVDNAGDRVYETTTTSSSIDAGGTDTVFSYIASITLSSFVEHARIMGTGTTSLTGNSLNNVIYAGSGDNQLKGEGGIDTLSYAYGLSSTSTTGVKISLASSTAQTTGGSGVDTVSGFENLTGSSKNDNLTGSLGNNTLNGGSGNDTLSGGSGNDILIGSAAKDALYGGSGNDIFDFNGLSETGTSSTTWDVIADFVRGQDKLDLSTLDANTATTANEAFNGSLLASTASFTAAGQLKLLSGVLYGNTDADSTAEFAIALTGISTLSAADFVL